MLFQGPAVNPDVLNDRMMLPAAFEYCRQAGFNVVGRIRLRTLIRPHVDVVVLSDPLRQLRDRSRKRDLPSP